MSDDCITQPTVSQGITTPTGLSAGGLVTEVSLNAVTWTALPPVALSGRNAIAVQNYSGTEIKINYSSAIVGYVGMILPTGGERSYDITDTIFVYAKASAGTPTITVEEIA